MTTTTQPIPTPQIASSVTVPPSTTFNEKSSFTADRVAYRRTFTGIPFSQEIWNILQETARPLDPEREHQTDDWKRMVPFFESRYLLTDRILEESGIDQILELASGLSPRGLNLTRQRPDIRYVELDLLNQMIQKRKVVERLCRKLKTDRPDNLHLVIGNIINDHDIDRATSFFRPHAKICVICEGLLRYMSWPDKETLRDKMWTLLKENGGIWITPDIEFLGETQLDKAAQARYDKMATETGIDVRSNLFPHMIDALSFFRNPGFRVDVRSHLEIIDELQSPSRLGIAHETITGQISRRYTFTMTPS
jgi:O-methyltransferase involved in polyketide biosynthesis